MLPGWLATGSASGRPSRIDFVDFRQWGSFAAYRRDVSESIRRDYRKAAANGARVETPAGNPCQPAMS